MYFIYYELSNNEKGYKEIKDPNNVLSFLMKKGSKLLHYKVLYNYNEYKIGMVHVGVEKCKDCGKYLGILNSSGYCRHCTTKKRIESYKTYCIECKKEKVAPWNKLQLCAKCRNIRRIYNKRVQQLNKYEKVEKDIEEEPEKKLREEEVDEEKAEKVIDDAGQLIEREKKRQEEKKKGWKLCEKCNSNRVAPSNKEGVCLSCQKVEEKITREGKCRRCKKEFELEDWQHSSMHWCPDCRLSPDYKDFVEPNTLGRR